MSETARHPFEELILTMDVPDFEILAEAFLRYHGPFDHNCLQADYDWMQKHDDDINNCRLFHPNRFDDALRAISHQANAEASHNSRFYDTSALEGWRLEAGRGAARLAAIRVAELKEEMGLGKKDRTNFGRAAINLIAVWGELLAVAGSVIDAPMTREVFCRSYPGHVRSAEVEILSEPIMALYGSITPW